MRIALISYEYPPETGFGGIGTYTHHHAHALSRLGHEVHVFAGTVAPERRTYRDGSVTVTRLRKFGFVERMLPKLDRHRLHWFKNRLLGAANSFSALRRELKNGAFDVVEMPECGGEGALINHCLDVPTVVRLHSPAELIMDSYGCRKADRILTAMVERLGMSGATAISSCSNFLAEEVRRRGLLDRPITVIPNGIDLAVFDRDEGIDIHERFGVPRDGLRIFFANRLEPRKGVHVVRELLLPVLERHPDVTFVLAGYDPKDVVQKELLPMLAERGFEHRLVHLGRITLGEVRACLKQCEIFLLPSTWENAPYSLLEAMAAGKAIVASDCGGIPEILRHDIDGLIARTGDAAAFQRAIDRLQSAKLRLRLGRSARARVESRYTADLVARRSVEFYQWVLGAPADGRRTALTPPIVELGPDDWFQAWWLRGEDSGERPAVGPDFAQLGVEELAFVHAVLARVYWAERGRNDADVVAFLGELSELQRRVALRARDNDEPVVSGRLGMPAFSHPLFGDLAALDALLGELWRLGDHALVADWLVREVGAVEFTERARRLSGLRRLAVDAFRRRPNDQTAAVLRRIYRAVGSSARVAQQDRDLIAKHAHLAAFGALIEDLGLHAPLRRPPVFGSSRRRDQADSGTAEVTVLIPSFCHEPYVAKAIESVLAQTHEHVRVLVVDDCSSDGTVAAARAINDDRVEVRSNKSNLGLGGSILAALPTIETPYVALLNSDDVFHPERLQRCLAVLAADPGAALVASRVAIMDEKERQLLPANSCVLDLGASAHGWVRWYDRVTTPLSADDWTALPALLRQNHLATSSNVVCRTSFLRDRQQTLAPLKYCLDWSLFLHASVDGSLRFVDEELVGYRLHGANTVWFDDDTRPGYVHEVNAVVADVLRAHVAARRAAGDAAEAIAEEVAGLLLDGVQKHGETHGLALFLAELTADLGVEPAAFCSPELVRLARAALAPPAIAADDPMSRRTRVDRCVVESLLRRTRELEPLVGRLRQEAAAAREGREDAAAYRQRIDDCQAAVDAAGQELAALLQEHARFDAERAARTDELGESERQLANSRESLRLAQVEIDRMRASLALAADELATARARQAAAAQDSARLTQQLHEAGQRERALRRALDAQALAAARELVAQRSDQTQFEHGLEFRVGRLLTRKLHLMGALKTALRLGTGLRNGASRALAGLGKTVSQHRPERVVVACHAGFPGPDTVGVAAELLALRGAGLDVRILCWSGGALRWLDDGQRTALRHRFVLGRDAALAARDRRFFVHRDPEAVAAIDAFPLPDSELARIFTFARSARSHRAGYLHATGLWSAGLLAFGASRLLGVPFGLRLEHGDLKSMEQPGWCEVVRAASTLVVASEAAAEHVRAVLGAAARHVLVVPPFVEASPGSAATGGARFVCVGPFPTARGLLVLADAAKNMVDRGVDARFEVIGARDDCVATATALVRLRGRLVELGMHDHFVLRGEVDPGQLAAALASATALVDVRSGDAPELPGPTRGALAAMAMARPVVAFAGGLAATVRDDVDGRLVALDGEALASALTELAHDADLRRRLGDAARQSHAARFAPDHIRGALCERIRALLDSGPE